MQDYRIVLVIKAEQPPIDQTRTFVENLENLNILVDTADVQIRDENNWSIFNMLENIR